MSQYNTIPIVYSRKVKSLSKPAAVTVACNVGTYPPPPLLPSLPNLLALAPCAHASMRPCVPTSWHMKIIQWTSRA